MLALVLKNVFSCWYSLKIWHKLVTWEERTSFKVLLPSDQPVGRFKSFPDLWLMWEDSAHSGRSIPRQRVLSCIWRKDGHTMGIKSISIVPYWPLLQQGPRGSCLELLPSLREFICELDHKINCVLSKLSYRVILLSTTEP